MLTVGALGRPRGKGWGGRWNGGSGWGTHVNPWLIHVNVWQKPLQYCKIISLQLIKINGKKKKKKTLEVATFILSSRKTWTKLKLAIFCTHQKTEVAGKTATHSRVWRSKRTQQSHLRSPYESRGHKDHKFVETL